MAKAAPSKEKDSLYKQIALKCKEVTTEILHLERSLYFVGKYRCELGKCRCELRKV